MQYSILGVTYGTSSPLLEGRNLPKIKCMGPKPRDPGLVLVNNSLGRQTSQTELNIRHPARDLQIDTCSIEKYYVLSQYNLVCFLDSLFFFFFLFFIS